MAPGGTGVPPKRGVALSPAPDRNTEPPPASHTRRGLSPRGRRSSAEVSPWRRTEPGPGMEKYERIRVVGRGAFG